MVALLCLKTKTLNILHPKKFQCVGDFFYFVSLLLKFATLPMRSQLIDIFLQFSSDFDLAQDFSCSRKTVVCGQIFLLACGPLRKKGQHNLIR